MNQKHLGLAALAAAAIVATVGANQMAYAQLFGGRGSSGPGTIASPPSSTTPSPHTSTPPAVSSGKITFCTAVGGFYTCFDTMPHCKVYQTDFSGTKCRSNGV
jgi:hypothetical protein